jgi:hypothetical protein
VEVLTLVALGMVTADIAAALHLSRRTVEAHLAAMLHRSGSRTRAHLVALAYASGIFANSAWPPITSGTFCLSAGCAADAGITDANTRNPTDCRSPEVTANLS